MADTIRLRSPLVSHFVCLITTSSPSQPWERLPVSITSRFAYSHEANIEQEDVSLNRVVFMMRDIEQAGKMGLQALI